MSSLIIAGISIQRNRTTVLSETQEWFCRQIQSFVHSLERIYSALPDKSPKNLERMDEIITYAEEMQNRIKTSDLGVDALTKFFELFVRKIEKTQIIFRKQLFDIHESKELEYYLKNQIMEICKEISGNNYLDPEGPVIQSVKERYISLGKLKGNAERINSLKEISIEMEFLLYSCEEMRKDLLKEIQELKAELLRLERQNISLRESNTTRIYFEKLAFLESSRTIEEMNSQLSDIKQGINRFTHAVLGREYIELTNYQSRTLGSPISRPQTLPAIVERRITRKEAEFFQSRIQEWDPDNRPSDVMDLLKEEANEERYILIRDNLQLLYGLVKEKIPARNYIRDYLEGLIDTLQDDPQAGGLLDQAMELYQDSFPDLVDLGAFRRQYTAFFIKKLTQELSDEDKTNVINQVLKRLADKGYLYTNRYEMTGQRVTKNRAIEIQTTQMDYSLIFSINPLHELVFRLVRIADRSEPPDPSDEMRYEKDRRIAEIWSRDYDEIRDGLNKEGIILIERLRINPDTSQIPWTTRFDLFTSQQLS